MEALTGGISAVPGMLAAGITAGIKRADAPDLALLLSEREATVAGVFTTNRVVAAPVRLTRARVQRGKARAILINSGNANACTGPRGYKDAMESAVLTARALRLAPRDVLVASTGVIGRPLPMDRMRAAIPVLASRLRRDGGPDAARAIMTTDTTLKMSAQREIIGGRAVTLGGIAKGSGMIHPKMATMLAFLATDAVIPPARLRAALRGATAETFNRLPLDGDTSTNDMVLCLANGLAGNRAIRPGSADARRFEALLEQVCLDLAKQIARDGEGASKCVELVVEEARTHAEALRVAEVIGTSSLVKTAWFGEDANWGRIMAAIGRAGVRVMEDRIAITYGAVPVVRRGVSLGQSAEERANLLLKDREFTVTVSLGQGHATVTVWTMDLSTAYVKINASYRS